MDSTKLLYFKAIAEAESLTKAAQSLHVSQPALSKSLSGLEKEMDRPLFNRVGGRLYLNSDGKALLEYANQIDFILGQIEERFTNKKVRSETLSLYSIGNYFSFIMKNYFQFDTQPMQLKVVPNKEIAEALFSGDADIAIADSRFLESNPDTGLVKIPILSEQLLLMIPKSHALAGRKTVSLEELVDYPIMRLNTHYWLEEIAADTGLGLNISWSVDSETWNYYWTSYGSEVPLSFDSSASFVTHDMLSARQRRCNIAKVEGPGTNRMLYLWYFKKNEERLASFLNCVKMSFR